MPRSPCSSAVAGSANRRCALRPIAGASPERSAAGRVGAPVPSSNRRSFGPTPPACRHKLRRPRLVVAGGSGPPNAVIPAVRRPGLGCGPDAPPPPATVPRYPPRYGVCVRSPSYPRRSLWAPFFRGLYRLAVGDGRPFGKLRRDWSPGPRPAAASLGACRGPAANFRPDARCGSNGKRCATEAGHGAASARSNQCAVRSGWR